MIWKKNWGLLVNIFWSFGIIDLILRKKVKRKVQGVPKSQVTASSSHQGEEERDTNQHTQNKQTHEKHTEQLSFPQAR